MNHSIQYERVKKTIEKYITYEQKIAIWVSWWPDSMYLLKTIQYWRKQKDRDQSYLHIVSCDHNTRENTKNEIISVKELSKKNTFYTDIYAGKNFSEKSLRERRHEVFINYCKDKNINIILLGHHLNDRIETTFLNMKRWTWTKWLIWLEVKTPHFLNKSITIIRPLLSITKNEIIVECQKNNILYCEDPTNIDITYSQRNLIRKLFSKIFNTKWFYKSMKVFYETIETEDKIEVKPNKVYEIFNSKWKCFFIIKDDENNYITTIKKGERDSDLLYKLYSYYDISINPRSNTLENLANSLNKKNWNKISYTQLTIQSFKYSSIIKINNILISDN